MPTTKVMTEAQTASEMDRQFTSRAATASTTVQSYTTGPANAIPLQQPKRTIRWADQQPLRRLPPPPPGAYWFRDLPNPRSPEATSRPINIPVKKVITKGIFDNIIVDPKAKAYLNKIHRGPSEVHLQHPNDDIKHDYFAGPGWGKMSAELNERLLSDELAGKIIGKSHAFVSGGWRRNVQPVVRKDLVLADPELPMCHNYDTELVEVKVMAPNGRTRVVVQEQKVMRR